MAVDLRGALEEKLYPRHLNTYVAGLRAAGRTWRQIATELTERTDIAVSHETLRTWFGNHDSKGEM